MNKTNCRTAEELEKTIKDEWNPINIVHIQNIINSMPKRVQAVIDQR